MKLLLSLIRQAWCATAILLTILLSFAATSKCQDLEPAEVLQNVMAEHAMTPALYWKAPMSLDLDLAPVPEVIIGVTGDSGGHKWVWPPSDDKNPYYVPAMVGSDAPGYYCSSSHDCTTGLPGIWDTKITPRPVNSDANVTCICWGIIATCDKFCAEQSAMPPPAEAPLPVRTATWQVPPAAAGCTGVCVTFSAQGAAALKAITGKRIKGFELIDGTVCDLGTTDRKFAGGLIIQQANAMNIQTIGGKAASAIVQQTVDLNFRNLAKIALKYGPPIVLGFMIPGTLPASKAWQAGVNGVSVVGALLPNVLAPGTPNPDPFLNNILDEQGMISLGTGACVLAQFAGVWSRDAVKVTGRVQLLP